MNIDIVIRDKLANLPADDIEWLEKNGVNVFYQEGLHAKIYMNEKTVFISSMNLQEHSAMNSHEVGLIVKDQKDKKAIYDYVNCIYSLLPKIIF